MYAIHEQFRKTTRLSKLAWKVMCGINLTCISKGNLFTSWLDVLSLVRDFLYQQLHG